MKKVKLVVLVGAPFVWEMFNDTKIRERCSLSYCQPKVEMEIKDKKELRKENEK